MIEPVKPNIVKPISTNSCQPLKPKDVETEIKEHTIPPTNSKINYFA